MQCHLINVTLLSSTFFFQETQGSTPRSPTPAPAAPSQSPAAGPPTSGIPTQGTLGSLTQGPPKPGPPTPPGPTPVGANLPPTGTFSQTVISSGSNGQAPSQEVDACASTAFSGIMVSPLWCESYVGGFLANIWFIFNMVEEFLWFFNMTAWKLKWWWGKVKAQNYMMTENAPASETFLCNSFLQEEHFSPSFLPFSHRVSASFLCSMLSYSQEILSEFEKKTNWSNFITTCQKAKQI